MIEILVYKAWAGDAFYDGLDGLDDLPGGPGSYPSGGGNDSLLGDWDAFSDAAGESDGSSGGLFGLLDKAIDEVESAASGALEAALDEVNGAIDTVVTGAENAVNSSVDLAGDTVDQLLSLRTLGNRVKRTCREAVALGREQGVRLGLIRPITLWPFPTQAIRAAAKRRVTFLVVEMSLGQLAEDVRLALEGRRPVDLIGRPAVLASAQEILERALSLIQSSKA